MPLSDLKYPFCWVAYFDLLGFRRIVEHTSIWQVLEHYNAALDKIRELGHWTPAKWFSDTFLFYTRDDSRNSFGKIVGASEVFFHSMLRSRVPVRGCLAFGEFHAGEGDALFGPALTEAYDEAEAQDWLGLILTRRAEDRIKHYEINGRTVYNVLREDYWRDYSVPFNGHARENGKQPQSAEDCCRLVYTMNCGSLCHGSGDPDSARLLWYDLVDMQCAARDHAKTPLEAERIDRKYENTKAFLLDTVPKLSEYVRK